MRIEYHRTLIADHVRNEVLFKALQAVIKPGESIVSDIGAGSGLLGLMAAKLGAKEVYLYETAEVADVAEEVIAASGFTNCFLMPCHSTEMQDPPKSDVIISETLGNYAFEEDIISTLNDARERFLAPGGVMLPNRVRQFAAPVTASRFDSELNAWRKTGEAYGLDFSHPQMMSCNNVYVRRLKADDLMPESSRLWDEVDFCKPASAERSGLINWAVQDAADVYGFAVWWEAGFGDGLVLSTGPKAPATHWEQLYFPLERAPIRVEPGMGLALDLHSFSDPGSGTHLAWKVQTSSPDGDIVDEQSMDLDRGYLP